MSDYASSSSRPASPVGELPTIPNARPFRFAYDAASRRQGPGSVSETTEGRGDYFAGQTPYEAYAPSTASLPVGAFPPDWSSSIHGFHAISTVVNSPHKKSAPPKAHSSLPAVPPAELPRVRRKDFDSYLKAVAPEWERFQQNAEQGREGVAQINTHVSSSERSSTSVDLPTTPRTPRPSPGKALPLLESVPEVYFDRNFNLGDPRTFNIVTEFSDQHEGFMLDDPASFSYAQPLIDKLSTYADTIEQHLVREISLRSTSFFAALSNLQDLQTESEQCLGRIKQSRTSLKDVDEKGAVKGLEVVRLESRMRNMGKLRGAVAVVGSVIEMVGVAKGLVNAGQWGEALDVIDELDTLWDAGMHQTDVPQTTPAATPIPNKNGRISPLPTVAESPPTSPPPQPKPASPVLSHKKPAPSIPISSLQAFSALPSNLRTLTLQIASSLTSEIVNVLRLDLVDRIDHGKSVLNGHPAMNGSEISSGKGLDVDMHMSLKDRLRPLLHSLVRTGGVRETTVSWREVVLTELNGLLKRHIPRFNLDEEDPSTGQSVNEILNMEHDAFQDLTRKMYEYFLNSLEGLQAQNSIVIDVLEGIRQPKPLDITAMKEDLADILSSAGELANARAAKVFGLRAEQNTKLELREFWTLFNVSWDFVVKSEVICRRMIVGLRGVVVSQSKTFLQAFHQSRLSQSAKLVEDEQWNPAEVSPLVQHVVDLLVDASIHDPAEFSFAPPPTPNLSSPSHLTPSSPVPPSASTLNGSLPQPSSPVPSPSFPPPTTGALKAPSSDSPRRRSAHATPGKHLKIEDRHFFAVGATTEVLVLLSDYLRVIVNLPMLVTDTMSRVIELLKAFNSRTCQVVLGAGAMRSAGLKNITAKHLALASQSLSIMISLIPYVRETFRRHLSQKQAVMLVEFDKLKRDYQEHQNEIHAKLIAIMGDRLSAHIRTLQTVKWDTPKPGGGVNDYMELLVKETVTLHKVLSRYLAVSVVEYVMTQVFAAINHRLSEEYVTIDLPSAEAKERLLADARFLHEKLSGLKNVRAPTAMLEIVVQEKRVSAPAPPQTNSPVAPTSPAPNSSNTGSRFAHMFSRAEPLRRATTPVAPAPAPTPPPSVPLQSPTPDVEKALPILSPSPDPPTPGLTQGQAAASPSPPLPPRSPQPAALASILPGINGDAQTPELAVTADEGASEHPGVDVAPAEDEPTNGLPNGTSEVNTPPPTPPKEFVADAVVVNNSNNALVNGDATSDDKGRPHSPFPAEKQVQQNGAIDHGNEVDTA